MQILVLVATIETSICASLSLASTAFKTVAGKVSLKLANMQGLVGPKSAEKSI